MAKQITFRYKGKDYILEFDRDTATKADVSFKELEDMENTPESALVIIPKLWRCSFLKHHPSVSPDMINEIYDNIAGKDATLPAALVEIYAEPLLTLFSNEGNVEWTKSW